MCFSVIVKPENNNNFSNVNSIFRHTPSKLRTGFVLNGTRQPSELNSSMPDHHSGSTLYQNTSSSIIFLYKTIHIFLPLILPQKSHFLLNQGTRIGWQFLNWQLKNFGRSVSNSDLRNSFLGLSADIIKCLEGLYSGKQLLSARYMPI